MTQAARDNNQVPVMLGVLNTDGKTPTAPKASDTLHAIMVDDGTGGTDQSGSIVIPRDQNQVTTLAVLSSAGDGAIVLLYVDSSGNLLTKST